MKRLLGIVLAFMILISLPVSAAAAQNTDDTFIIQKDEMVNRDVFAGAGYIKNFGTINGDIFAATGDFENMGKVTGDIILGAGNSQIGGQVDGNLRIGAGKVVINGEVGRNVTALCSDLQLEKNAAVNGNMNALAGNLIVNGFVGGDLRSGADNIQINGVIKGDVEVETSKLQFGPDAKIHGNLTYISSDQIAIPEGIVMGEVTQKEPTTNINLEQNRKKIEKSFKIIHVVRRAVSLLSYLIIGTILALVFTSFMKKTSGMLEEKPWHSLGIGLVGLIVIPIAALLMIITVIGIPLGIISFMLYGILLYLAKLPCALWIGNKILKGEEKPLLPMLLGIFLLLLVSYIPYLGRFVSFVAITFGIGSYLINIRNVLQKPKDIEPLL